MTIEGALALLLVLVVSMLVIMVGGGIVLALVALRWRRNRPGRPARPKPAAHSPAASSATMVPRVNTAPPPPATTAAAARSEVEAVEHGDVDADDPRIVPLGLEPATSTEAVFRNLEKIKPLLHAEAAESDRIGRTTPLAGGALRAAGLFRWGFPKERGGLGASYADRLEAVTRVARIDAGMAWVTMWLGAHGDIAGRLDDAAFAEIYPSVDLPTVFSATPLAKAVEVAGDKYRIEESRWRLGSGGYHADRWMAGAKVWDAAGDPVIDEATGEQKFIGVWLPADKVRQADDWNPMGVRSSGSASYFLAEPVEIPRSWSFNAGADSRPYFFPFMGVLVGAAQHLIDLTFDALRAKSRAGTVVGSYDRTALTGALASLDMLVLGLRGYAQYLDRVREERESGELTRAEEAWVHTVGMPVRESLIKIRDVTADIYGTGYVSAGSEFGRVLRDIQVAFAHGWLKLSDTGADHGARVAQMLENPEVVPIWDTGWPVELTSAP
ncbi:hypothetical protein [Microbacterium sp. CPCC 204701]|uniref:hypothetical protein n=1 Tax=Microbacterium sp. CPCC 204701 TaxID=2493084 RepID=UPI000FD85C47|nr:hypothetical protein [Microbacterium sp. CPCC 204701]